MATEDYNLRQMMERFVVVSNLAESLERASRGGITREGCDQRIADAIRLMNGSDYNAMMASAQIWAAKERESLRVVIGKVMNEAGRIG